MFYGGLRTKGLIKQTKEGLPLITVVTVVRNGEKTIKETMMSVTGQTYGNIEYIIVDGGSLDGTIETIRRHEKWIDYWVSETDSGIYDAMNKAMNLATGDWIYFLGSDDVLYSENIIFDVVKCLNDVECIYYGDVCFKYKRYIYAGKFSKLKLLHKNIPHQAIFYPKSVYKKNSYLTKYKVLADYYYNISLFGNTTFEYMNCIVALYDDRGYSSQHKDIQFKRNKISIVHEHFGMGMTITYLLITIPYKLYIHIKNRLSLIGKKC